MSTTDERSMNDEINQKRNRMRISTIASSTNTRKNEETNWNEISEEK